MEKTGINTIVAMLLIGGSAGSLDVLLEILPQLNNDLPFPILIILHRKSDAQSVLSDLLAFKTVLPVKEVEDKDKIFPGIIFLAPADYHVLIEQDGTFSLDVSEKVNYSRPSIDVSFESAADAYGYKTAGLLLSGANADGTLGLKAIKEAGGITLVQLPSSAEVSYMPQQAVNEIDVDAVLKNEEIAGFINELGKGNILYRSK